MAGDSFQGTGYIDVQPGTRNKPVYLRLKAATASTKNDGSMPYGSTLYSAQVFAHRAADGVSSSVLISRSTYSGNTIIAYLSYSTTLVAGEYHLTARAQISVSGLSTYYREDYDLNRVMVKDR